MSGRRRGAQRLVVSNPNPDDDPTSDDGPYSYYTYQPPPLPPTTTRLASRVPRYPSSHPSSLSSPSSTSSPAADEPSTPALFADRRPDSPDLVEIPTKPHYLPKIPAGARPSSRRPATSPTASTPEFHSSHSVSDRVLILVTADSERYVNVDISNATNPAWIRECVFTKLNIFDDEDQRGFSIYRTEIGSFAIGEALSDEKLFELCRELGDDKGTLKLLVSISSARVHEPSPPLRPATSLSPINGSTILPPFIPYNTFLPLQPKRSRSRNDSVSSTSENLVADPSAGYEADYERDRSHGMNGLTVPSDRPSGRPASPLPQSSRPSSPLPPPRPLYDRNGNMVAPPPPPPPLSPNRATFEDNNLTPPGTQIRVPDVAPEKPPSEQSEQWRNHSQAGPRAKVDTSRRNRPSQHHSDAEDSPAESWVMVSDAEPHPLTPLDSHHSPSSAARARQQLSPASRFKPTSPYTGRPLAIPAPPRNPPPSVPVMSPDARVVAPVSRTAGHPVPSNWPVTYKGPDRPEQKPMPTSSSQWRRLTKTAKSMDNLRGSAMNHPTTLQPGGGRGRIPPLPNNRGGIRDTLLTAGLSASIMGPTPRSVRPLPIKGSSHSSTVVPEFSPVTQNSYGTRIPGSHPSATLMSPSNDPYPRPQSAFGGDTLMSPNSRYQRSMQTSGFGSSLDSDYGRLPRAPSPTHPLPTAYRSSQRPSDVRHSDPLQSPSSPRSPRYVSRERRPGSSSSDTPLAPSEMTRDANLSEDVGRWAAEQFSQFSSSDSSGSGTIMPDMSTFMPTLGKGVGTNMSGSSSLSYESESEDGESGTWLKPPTADRPASILRPRVTVLTDGLANQHPTFVTPTVPPREPSPAPPPTKSRKGARTSTFTAREEDTWAPRPPPEDMYERLEDFFPEHDLDKPVIEASSGGTSPTGTTADSTLAPLPPVPVQEKARVRGKKSIRLVAQERKKLIDRSSRGGGDASFTAVQRKRSTKLWGSKVEEVDTSSLPESPSTSEGPGATTFKWVRGELIGRGTYGRVYLALNATTGEMMAVKQVEIPRTASDKNDSRQVTVVQALKLESETLKVLDHPNIVQYLGFEETPANLSIFLEYVPGGSIGSCLLKHGKFDEEVTKSFTSQILAGLEYLHSQGILHRDLKSDNILVEMTGVCKISDFGISKRTDDHNDAHTAMQGTVFWMAPEVINSQKKGYNFKIDIWSIGCVVLEMWAGTRPWLGEEMVAVMFKLFQSKLPPPVPDGLVLSPLADDFRQKCFAINPEERPPAAELRKHPYLTLSPGWVFDGFASK